MAQQPLTVLRPSSERGSAMMEFVLSLPFLWLIIALCLGYGAGILSRHRASVIVREQALTSPGSTSMPQRDMELLRAVRLSGDYSVQRTGDGLEGAAGLDIVMRILASMSNAQKLCFDGIRQTNVGPLPDVALISCFEVGSNSWTYDETRDVRVAMIAGAIGGGFLGDLIGKFF